jgi:hypothetical protein
MALHMTRFAALLACTLTAVRAIPHQLRHATLLGRQDQLAESYDYIIAGAGTAGLTVADRLTADGKC